MFWRLEYFLLCFVVLGLFAAPISCAEKRTGIVYTRDQLMALRPPSFVVGEKPQIPKELKRKRRGSKAGVKQRIKRRRFKPCVPAVITGNVRSLANKMDELEALTRIQREYREASIMFFTETWLHGLIPDSNVMIAGFSTVNRWCNPEYIHVKERVCSPDVELIAIGLRPYYLPREFTNVIAITVYIPPTVRVMFFDFSSAFNTIQPRLLRAKLENMQMDAPLVSWIEDSLTGRTVCENAELYVQPPDEQHRGSTRNCAVPLSVHHLHS
ncbi:hypothetical protein D4764_02G0004050 [Takifugu flavidus]|uniref:Uncharacterized protein n=1 Tax=Takifugu flavidus TaxID=433684 RepID=A0A5C6NIT1_9TELE|nr:hypothetical protein D4764_02G0004050 [Takifugu flavidus]